MIVRFNRKTGQSSEGTPVPGEGVLLPVQRPRLRPVLRSVAAVTLAAFTITSIVPSVFAQTVHSKETLRPVQEAEGNNKEKVGGLEERLRASGSEPISADPVLLTPTPSVSAGGQGDGLATTTNFWVNRSGSPIAGKEEDSAVRVDRRTALAAGLLGTAAVATALTAPVSLPAQDVTPPQPKVVAAAPKAAAKPAPRPVLVEQITSNLVQNDKGQIQLETVSRGTRSDRVIAPPTKESRHPMIAAVQAVKATLTRGQELVRSFLTGPSEVIRWFAVKNHARSIIPKNHPNVILSLNDFRPFIDQGPERVAVVLKAIGAAAKAQGSKVSIALDIGAFVDNRDFSDLKTPISANTTRDYLVPFVTEAKRQDIKVLPYSSDRGVMLDIGSYKRELQDALQMGFDREAIVTDWEWWASPPGVENLWETLTLNKQDDAKAQLALEWLKAHQQLLTSVISDKEIPVTAKPTQIYALVNQDFAQVLIKALDGKPLPSRFHLVVMAYNTPRGKEAEFVQAAQKSSADLTGQKASGYALNFERDASPDQSLNGLAVEGKVGETVQQIAAQAKTGGEPLFMHIPSHRDLTSLMETGKMVPVLPADQVELAQTTAIALGKMVLGGTPKSPEIIRRYLPRPEDTATVTNRIAVEPVTHGIGFGTTGVGTVGAVGRNVEAWMGKGVWWFLDPDTFILGPEAGLTVSAMKKIVGTLVRGELETVSMELIVTPLGEDGRPSGPALPPISVMGVPDPTRELKGARYDAQLRVKLRRPGERLAQNPESWPLINASIEAEVALGYPGYGRTPLTVSEAIHIPPGRGNETAEVTIPLGEITPTISFFILRSRDSQEKITGWYGPVNPMYMSQFTDYLLDQKYKTKWAHLETVCADPNTSAQLLAEATEEMNRMGGHVTALQLAVDHRGDLMVPVSVEEYKDAASMRAQFQSLREHGVTHISVRVPEIEQNADKYLVQYAEKDIWGVDYNAARDILGRQEQQFLELIRIAHEAGLNVGLQLDEAEIDRLTDPNQSVRAKERLEKTGLKDQSHGLEIIRLIVKANEEFHFQLDFFNLNLKKGSGESRVRAEIQAARERRGSLQSDMQKLMDMLDTLLVETGDRGGRPTEWNQYATRVSVNSVTPDTAREILETNHTGLVQRAQHRYPQALFLQGGSLNEIITTLNQRFPSLVNSQGQVDPQLLEELIQRIRVPSTTAFRAVSVPENRIAEVQQWASTLTDEQIRQSIQKKEDRVRFLLAARAWEIGMAQEPVLARYQNPIDLAFLAAHEIQMNRLLTVGDTHPKVVMRSLPTQQITASGQAVIEVEIKNEGNLPAQYMTILHLMGETPSGRPAWPLDEPRLERFTKEVILKPGESQRVRFVVDGNILRQEGHVNFRVLARDVNTLLHKPGQGLDMEEDEEAFARAEGTLYVTLPQRLKAIPDQAQRDEAILENSFHGLRRRFERAEALRRERTGESFNDAAYAQGYGERYMEYMAVFAPYYTMGIRKEGTGSGTILRLTFQRTAQTLQEHLEDVRSEQRQQLETIALLPDQSELATARWLRKGLEYGMKAGLVALAIAAFRNVRSSARRGYEGAALEQSLSTGGLGDGTPVGRFSQFLDMNTEWSHRVEGMGARWTQDRAGNHPEQGKVARAMRATGRFVIGLRDDIQDQAMPIVSRQQSRLEWIQKIAPKVVTGALVVIGSLAALGAITLPAAGIALAVLVAAVVLLAVPVIGPVLQRLISVLFFLPLDLAAWAPANGALLILGPIIFFAMAAIGLSLIGTLLGVAVTVFSWQSIAVVALIWAALWLYDGVGRSPYSAISFTWRIVGALGIGAVAAVVVFALTYIISNALLFWFLVGVVFFWAVRATHIFTSSPAPLMAYAEWVSSYRFLVRWAITGLVIYAGVMLAAAASTVIMPILLGAVPVTGIAALATSGLGVISLLVIGTVLLTYLLGSHYQLYGTVPFLRNHPILLWTARVATAAALAAAIPWLLGAVPAFFASMLPAFMAGLLLPVTPTVGTYVMGLVIFGRAAGLIWRGIDYATFSRPANQPISVTILRALFHAVVLGVGAAMLLPLGLLAIKGISIAGAGWIVFWLMIVPSAALILAALWDWSATPRYWLQEQFERERVQQAQLIGAIQVFEGSGAQRVSAANLHQMALPQLRAEFATMAAQPGQNLSASDRTRLLSRFRLRQSPDQLPLVNPDLVVLQAAWADAVAATHIDWHHGVPQLPSFISGNQAPTQIQQMIQLTPDQQRVLNWYYWRHLAERDADTEVRRLSTEQGSVVGLADLSLADQELAVTPYFNWYMNRFKDTILNQDEGTTLRTLGGFLWTSDLQHLVGRFRQDDSLAVVMPALILSLEYAMDGPSVIGGAQIRNANRNYGVFGVVVVTVVMWAQVALMNIAVPLGFIASMVNRWGRSKVQGGNVLHTLRASADAGMEGYQKAFWYVILVLGRWLQGLLFTLMEVYLGRWVGRRDLEEYQATRVFEGSADGDGTLSNRVRTLLHENTLNSLVEAHYAGLIGEDNSLFDMGRFAFPSQMRNVPWQLRGDGPGIQDAEAFGDRSNNQQLPGTIEWRTEGGIGGGHARVAVRFEIIDSIDLSGAGLEESKVGTQSKLVLERLADGTVRIRKQGESLRYLVRLNKDQKASLDQRLAQNSNNWKATARFFETERDAAIDQLKARQREVRNLERAGAPDIQIRIAKDAVEAANKQVKFVSPIADGLISENGRYLYAFQDGSVTRVFVNGQDQETLLTKNRQRRLSTEPGKVYVQAPTGRTKGENAGAGLAYAIGLVEPRLQLTRDGNSYRVNLPFRTMEEELFPELGEARHEIQDHGDRQHGVRAHQGVEAARVLNQENDERLRRHRGIESSISALPQGEFGHHQVRDRIGQRGQWLLNAAATLLRWERDRDLDENNYRSGLNPLRWSFKKIALLIVQVAAFSAVLWLVLNGMVALTSLQVIAGVLFGITLLATQFNWWWTLKIIAGFTALYFAWPWGLAMAITGPTFAAFLWGYIKPISFIGNVQHNRIQGMRGHYQSEMIESAFDRLEARIGLAQMGPVLDASQQQYDAQLRDGLALIQQTPALQTLAELYHRVIGPEELTVQRPWWNLLRYIPIPGFPRRPITNIPFLRGVMQVEPTLRRVIRQVETGPSAGQEESGGPGSRTAALADIERLLVREMRDFSPAQRRAVFEALRWNTALQFAAIGNRAISDQYSRSRDPEVTRMGDVNSQFGVEGQDRLTRLQAQQQLLNGQLIQTAYPFAGNRSWTRSSDAAIYGGIPAPSLTYSGSSNNLLNALARGAQNGGFIIERMAINSTANGDVLYIDSALLANDYGNTSGIDKGRGLLILVHEAGLITDEQYETMSSRLSDIQFQGGNVGAALNTFLRNGSDLAGIVVVGTTWTYNRDRATQWKPELKVSGDFKYTAPSAGATEQQKQEQKIKDEAALNEIFDKASQSIRRINPLRAALDQKSAGQTLSNYLLENTSLQPDLEVLQSDLNAQSEELNSVINTEISAEQLNQYYDDRQAREGDREVFRITAQNVNWRAIGFSGNTLQEALAELRQSIAHDGTISLTPRRNLLTWAMDLFNLRNQSYSREVVLLQLLFGANQDQLLMRGGRVVGLRWSNLDSHFDASQWQFAVGPYLWPGSTMGRVALWMRRGRMHQAPPIPFLEAVRLLEMSPNAAVASGFNRLPTDAFSLPQLLTEDGRHGSLNRLTPTLNPTMNAWNMHKIPFMQLQLLLRKGDKSTQRAVQYFAGLAIEQSFQHLFDHPLFAGVHPDYLNHLSNTMRQTFGLQAVLRDEVSTAGAHGAGTFSYGLTGYTGSRLSGIRVGPYPPGHVAAYWIYREYQALDEQWNGLFNATTRQLQREAVFARTNSPVPPDSSADSVPLIYQGDVVDPWTVLATAGAQIEQTRRASRSPHTPAENPLLLGPLVSPEGRSNAIEEAARQVRASLAQPVTAATVGTIRLAEEPPPAPVVPMTGTLPSESGLEEQTAVQLFVPSTVTALPSELVTVTVAPETVAELSTSTTITTAPSSTSVTVTAPVGTFQPGLFDSLKALSEIRVAVISAETALNYPELSGIAGKLKQIRNTNAYLLVLPNDPKQLEDALMELMEKSEVIVQSYGSADDLSLKDFRDAVSPFSSIHLGNPQPVNGSFPIVLSQILGALAGIAPESVTEAELAGVEEAVFGTLTSA